LTRFEVTFGDFRFISLTSTLYKPVCSRLFVFIGNPRWCCSVQIGILDELECVLQSVSSKRNTTESMVNICKLFIQAQILLRKLWIDKPSYFSKFFILIFSACRTSFCIKLKDFYLDPSGIKYYLWLALLSSGFQIFTLISVDVGFGKSLRHIERRELLFFEEFVENWIERSVWCIIWCSLLHELHSISFQVIIYFLGWM